MAAAIHTVEESVLIWRYEQFAGLGFTVDEATSLAGNTDIDLGRARRLIEAGCPSNVAYRILV
jgi:hypothetical protein